MHKARTRCWLFVRSYLPVALVLLLAPRAFAAEGQIQIHDPSTIIQCDGKYYVWGTGGRGLVSADGWTWERGVQHGGGGGLAPDVIHLGDRYYLYYAVSRGQPRAEIRMTSNKTLDPKSPQYKWQDTVVVASSDGDEDCNAIDPGVFLDPTDGRLWLTYGSYFGYIRLVELNPKNGKRLDPSDHPVDIAINCEASDMIYRDGWYYLLADHGSCCAGADSGYNIRVGRSRKITGPYLDNMGIDMIKGGGKLFLGSDDRHIGPGHFGLIDLGDDVQKFSCHYEADLDRGGVSVLDIRPLLWKDGWPIAGDNFKPGTYEIESVRTGTALELAVEGVPVGGRRARRGGGFGFGPPGAGAGPRGAGAGSSRAGAGRPGTGLGQSGAGPGTRPAVPTKPVPPQDAAQVSKNWPTGNIDLRMANYMGQAQEHWTITPVPDAGGYLGSPYLKITIAGTDRALAITKDNELTTLPAFTSTAEQLWRLDQLTDGTWRIMPKTASDSKDPLTLSAVGSSFATLKKFDPDSDKQRWIFKAIELSNSANPTP
ncbi:MAG TPA: family 43 glycosylhydrolase [Tepidisphaeraceae bacterium]|nr:family 43 glycosylhydrolase [Tepidisphaeraceae bacterium]